MKSVQAIVSIDLDTQMFFYKVILLGVASAVMFKIIFALAKTFDVRRK